MPLLIERNLFKQQSTIGVVKAVVFENARDAYGGGGEGGGSNYWFVLLITNNETIEIKLSIIIIVLLMQRVLCRHTSNSHPPMQ